MSHKISYPSPTAAQVGDGAGPFYTNQAQRVPAHDEIDMSMSMLAGDYRPSDKLGQGNDQEMQHHPDQKFSQMYAQQGHQQMVATPNSGSNLIQGEDSGSKRKPKVSRACDECRRKKIRCDAEGEGPGHKKCGNCTRTAATCDFSRVPMKRGPSKGYIKELSDRVDSLEAIRYAALNSNHSSPHGGNDFERSQDLGYGRKRTHSVSEQGYLQSQLQHAAGEKYPANGSWGSPDNFGAHQGYGRQAPYADMSYNSAPKLPMSPNGLAQAIIGKDMTPIELTDAEESLVTAYLQVIHPTFPLLGGSSHLIRVSLNGCSPAVKEAFFGAICAALRYIVPSIDRSFASPDENAARVLQNIESSPPSARSYQDNLVSLQAAIIMVLAVDIFGPGHSQPRPSRGVWFGLAMDAAEHLKLRTGHLAKPDIPPEALPMLHDGRRAWWTMIVIDRYHAAGVAGAEQIPDSVAILVPGDEQVLGEVFYQQARLSRSLLRLADTFLLPAGDVVFAESFKRLFAGDVELFRESFQTDLVTMPSVNIPYWHVKLLYARALAGTAAPSSETMVAARTLADLVLKNAWSPLTHHFATLAAKTLLEMVDFKSAKADAMESLAELADGIEQRAFKVPWDSLLLDAVKTRLHAEGAVDKGSLQNLADAAVGESDHKVMDWSVLSREGYLNAFAGAS